MGEKVQVFKDTVYTNIQKAKRIERYLRKECEKIEGKSIIIPSGKYKGRMGMICSVGLRDDLRPMMTVRPYSLTGDELRLVEDSSCSYYMDVPKKLEFVENIFIR